MAIGMQSDFTIYQDQLLGGYVETQMQDTNAFNTASRGAIRLVSEITKGNYQQESFFKNIPGLITRRDTTSVAAATDLPLTQDEFISVKLDRKIGPVTQTLDAFKKIGKEGDDKSLSFLLGSQVAKAVQVDQLGAGLTAVNAAIGAHSGLIFDATDGTLDTPDLVDGLANFGDAASRILVWVMHSSVYFNLVKNQIAANIDGVSNFNVAEGTPVTLNRPVLVTDDPALVTAGSPNTYHTLGLTADAVVLKDSEVPTVIPDMPTGLEQLVVRLQGEFSYNLGVRGTKWDVANGGSNPNTAAIGTGTNWDKVVTDLKSMAGIRINSR